jgi:gliding motility-associated-like protein
VITNSCNIVNPAFAINPAPLADSTYLTLGDPTGATAGPYFCGDNQFVLPFRESVQCGSIAPSDIRVLRSLGFPNPVTSAVPLACPNGRADSILVTCLYPFTAGVNLVVIKTGSDGNSLLSQCGSAMAPFNDTAAVIINDFSVWQPAVDSLGCIFNHKTVTFNENIFCYTIANDGSDLVLKDSAGTTIIPVSNAYGYCGPNGEQSTQMLMTFLNQQSPTATTYYLTVKMGNDGNTIANQCGRFLNVGDTLAIFHINNTIDVDLGSDISVCDNAPVAPVLSSGFVDPGLSYQWSFNSSILSGATNPTYTPAAPLVAGNYILDLYLISNPACKGSDTVALNINVTPTPVAMNYVGCMGDTAFLNAQSSGVGYQYQWYYNGTGLANDTLETYNATQPGIYTVLVSNGNCFTSVDDSVTLLPAPVAPQFNNQDQTVCTGTSIPPLSADNFGSVYQWYLNGVLLPGETNQTYTPSTASAGSDTIEVLIGILNGNCTETGTMVLTVVDNPVITAISDDHECEGALLFPTFDAGNMPGVTYQWTDQNSAVVSTSNTFSPSLTLAAGTYNYTVTASVSPGCTATDQVMFTVDQLPVIDVTGPSGNICELNPATLTATNSTPTPISTYQWSNGQNGSSISGIATNGTYAVTATDANGCVGRDSMVVAVDRILDAPTVICNTGSGGGFTYVYTWSAIPNAVGYEVNEGSGWINPNPVDNNITSHGTNNVVVNFMVRAIDNSLASGCEKGRESVPAACSVVIPNIITPNGDNVNDAFTIANIEQYPNNHMTILNRWGEEVFSSTYNNTNNVFKGNDLPDGVYFYMLELGDGRTEPYTGTVTINSGK